MTGTNFSPKSLFETLTLVCIWVISGLYHPAALVLSLGLGMTYVLLRNANIQKSISSTFYMRLTLIYIFFFVIHFILYQKAELFWIKGLIRVLSYFSFAMLIAIFPKRILESSLKLIIGLIVTYSLTMGVYINMIGRRNSFIFSHANHFAYVLVVLIVYNLSVKRGPYTNIWLLMLFVSLLTTQSIGGLISATAIVVSYAFFNKNIRITSRVFIPVAIAAGLIILAPIISNRAIEQYAIIVEYLNFDLILEKAKMFNPGGMGSGIWRLTYWTSILITFFDESVSTVIFGTGIDSMSKGNFIYSFIYTDPHNDYLRLLVEFGFAGLILILFNIRNLKRRFLPLRIKVIIYLSILLPFIFGNVITNTPFNFTLILVLSCISFEYKDVNFKKDYSENK